MNALKGFICLLVIVLILPIYAPAEREAKRTEEYNGFIAYLVKTGDYTADVCVKPDKDCGLQAFDIYLNVTDYKIESQYDLILGKGHFIAIGFETEMIGGGEYVITSLCFSEKGEVKIVRADFAIAHTPEAPAVDETCYEWSITVGQ